MNRLLFFLVPILLSPVIMMAQSVISITVDGSINPASASFIKKAIEKAEEENAECVIVHLNTPGGLLKSTRVIVSDILQSKVPVVVYVYPGGAHAGSAGVFVTMAAHIAVMSPGTNIGAAHPVSMQGSSDTIMGEKATNDAAAFIRTIAEKRDRNIEWADSAVRKSISITEGEAIAKNVIDFVAATDAELLEKLDGRTVVTETGSKTLNTKSAKIEVVEMSLLEKFLNMLSDPNIAYILMMIGVYGILFELYSPGAIFPGVIGIISLILAFYAMHTLPVNYAGLALIIFGVILLLLELKVVSQGILAIGGVTSLLLGSFFLFRAGSALEFIRVSWVVIIGVTGFTALFFLFVIGMGIRALKAKPSSGIEAMPGLMAETLELLNPYGSVRAHGELWNAESLSGPIPPGTKVKITEVRGLTLIVENLNDRTQETNSQ